MKLYHCLSFKLTFWCFSLYMLEGSKQSFSFHLSFTFMLYKLNSKDETTHYVTRSLENFIHKILFMVTLMQSKRTDWFNLILQCILTQFGLSFRELHSNFVSFCLLPRIIFSYPSWLRETWQKKNNAGNSELLQFSGNLGRFEHFLLCQTSSLK